MNRQLIIKKKIHILVITAIAFMVFAGTSWGMCIEPGCNQSQTQSQSQSQTQSQSANSNSNSSSSSSSNATGGNSTATVGNINAYGGAGGAGGSAVAYGGAGGQGGAGGSSTSYNSLKINYPENKRELPNIPILPSQPQLEFRGPYKSINEQVRPWTLTPYWNEEMVGGFPQCGWGCDIEIARLKQYPSRSMFTVVDKPNSAKVYTTIVMVYAKNPLELWGAVARLALEYGAYEVVEVAYRNIFQNKSTGWNIGIGGGVSAVSGGNDTIGGSVGGGTGVGSVTTGPIEKVHGAFIFYSL